MLSSLPSATGCGLAFSAGVFRKLVHARQLRGAGYTHRYEQWSYPGDQPPELPPGMR